ncbi:MAG: hypothetical protein ONB12_11360, partial [candidate division KSB1 bacterium]|nr:hypothetical protein [candidate division KSB1 bacterium]
MRKTARLLFWIVCLCLTPAAATEDLIARYADQWVGKDSFEIDPSEGALCLAVRGDPAGAAFAKLPFAFTPNAWYELSVQLRYEQNAFASAAMVGTDFANRDVQATDEWLTVSFRFMAPQDGGGHYVRLGLWQGRGRILFRSLRIAKLLPIHTPQAGIELGDGESITEGLYAAHYYFASLGTYAVRTLARFDAYFNTNRWDLTDGREVIYCHRLGSWQQADARLSLKISFRQSGYLELAASKNGVDWQSIGMIPRVGIAEFILPTEIFPAEQVFIRLQAGRPPTRIQIDEYRYQARVDSAAPNLLGKTHLLRIDRLAEAVNISRKDIETFQLKVKGNDSLNLFRSSRQNKAAERVSSRSIQINSQEALKGGHLLVNSKGDTLFSLQPVEPRSAIGEYSDRLKETDGAVIWSCESMRKIAPAHEPPRRTGRIVAFAAARNEYEAAQIVVFAKRPIRRLWAYVEPFRHPSGAVLPADSATVYRVGYVQVRVPTDERGATGLWPDPLLSFDRPAAVRAGGNQPLWLSIHLPSECPAGDYSGRLVLKIDAETVHVPLRLTVWDFTLPRETHLQSAVGLYLSALQRYHRLTDNKSLQRVFELYLRNLAQHRLSPIDPFALSPIRVNVDEGTLGVRLDFTQFDQAYRRWVQGLGFNTFLLSIPGLPSGNSLHLQPGLLGGFAEGTPQYEKLMSECLRQIRSHLEGIGALEQAY